jgi:hypothetical protein
MYSSNTFFLDMRDYTKRLRGYGVEDGMEKVEFEVNEG